MKKLYLLLVTALALVLSTSAFAQDNDTYTIDVGEKNDSGVSGKAELMEMNGKTTVKIMLEGTPKGGDHPAHFHLGDCDDNGKIVIPLNNVDGDTGMSTTTVDATIKAITEDGDHYLNVHLSPDEIETIVACGEAEEEVQLPDTGAGGMADQGAAIPMTALAVVGMFLAAGGLLVARSRKV